MTRARRASVAGALAAAALLSACATGSDEVTKTKTTVVRPTTTASTTTTVDPNAPKAPLTGLPTADGAALDRPALVVKIDNAPTARPQAGIVEADVVYEEQVEGGVTRLAAVFHSTDAEPLGPVRSFRTTDLAIAAPLGKPLFGYAGANAAFLRELRRSPLVDVGWDAQPREYRKDRSRRAPHNLFTASGALFEQAPSGAAAPPPLFEYRRAGEPATGGERASRLVMAYKENVETAVSYTWDPERKGWARVQNGSDHVDVAGRQVAPENVIVQFVRYVNTKYRDASGSAVPEGQLVGKGEAWLFTDGTIIKGTWAKPTKTSVTTYADAGGRPLRLTPGRTWVELNPPGQASFS